MTTRVIEGLYRGWLMGCIDGWMSTWVNIEMVTWVGKWVDVLMMLRILFGRWIIHLKDVQCIQNILENVNMTVFCQNYIESLHKN